MVAVTSLHIILADALIWWADDLGAEGVAFVPDSRFTGVARYHWVAFIARGAHFTVLAFVTAND